ncbi:MAG: hypothetical protein M0000_02605 [Actinomycetota bacterium]|nr:hypothetical protein [Actinomycetota bacterium]MDA8208798.1 hypothetical protein [Actinomycetota bacterium]
MEQLESDVKRVTDPSFRSGLEALTSDELRRRKEEAEAVETMVSYARRVVQGRLDTLQFDAQRLGAEAPGGDAVTALSSAIGKNTIGERGFGRFVDANLEDAQVEEVEQALRKMLASAEESQVSGDDASRTTSALAVVEGEISRWRKELFVAIDAIRAELVVRYRGDSGMVDELLKKVIQRDA